MIDAVAYKNGQKNHWRRTAWNMVADMTQNRREAIVLYLPGSTDLDAPEACRRGFRSQNLIAIERNSRVADRLRSEGRTCVVANLLEVIAAWPDHTKVAVLIADLQCGLTEEIFDLLCLWGMRPALSGSTLLLNMQRGRETGFMFNLSKASSVRKFTGIWPDHVASHPVTEHRAANAFMTFAALVSVGPGGGVEEQRRAYEYFWKFHRITFPPSYRSTTRSPYMDSAVAKCTLPCNPPTVPSEIPDGVFKDKLREREVRRMIAAALAIRTMRLRGDLRSK